MNQLPSSFDAQGAQFGTATERRTVKILEAKAYRLTNGCLISHLKPNAKGYIYASIGGRTGKRVRANRLVYKVYNGNLPDDILVRHTCDRRDCIEHTHLIPGTQADNSQDMKDRGRQSRLGKPPVAVQLLREAIEMQRQGYTVAQIAKIQKVAGRSSVQFRLRQARRLGL